MIKLYSTEDYKMGKSYCKRLLFIILAFVIYKVVMNNLGDIPHIRELPSNVIGIIIALIFAAFYLSIRKNDSAYKKRYISNASVWVDYHGSIYYIYPSVMYRRINNEMMEIVRDIEKVEGMITCSNTDSRFFVHRVKSIKSIKQTKKYSKVYFESGIHGNVYKDTKDYDELMNMLELLK